MVDEKTGAVSGNPADAAIVQDAIGIIRNKSRAPGNERDHAEAMKIEDMHRMIAWSEAQVASDVDWTQANISDVSRLLTIVKHLSMRAFMAMAFTLWTRFV